MKKIIKKIKEKRTALVMSIVPLITAFSTSSVFANGFTKAAESASDGVQSTGISIVKPLIIIAGVIIGIIFIVGTQRQKDEAKERIPWILLGVAIIIGASVLASTVYGWFS